ncbi:MAG: CPBP family intramembrane metalloprotease [Thermoleophilia bacterium]|nr:CPBP family intramembrane metalloprotease [Thermoleophilia bacterium]
MPIADDDSAPASEEGTRRHRAARDGLLILAYYGFFMVYNSAVREIEALHWVTLVLLPLAYVYLVVRRRQRGGLRAALASVGLRRGNLMRGVPMAVILGLALSVLQLLASNRSAAIWEMVVSGQIILYLPLTLSLLFLTAGFTEEFFFRGVLQTRLAVWWQREVPALLVAAALFGLYHFPYAYLLLSSPSHGQMGGALGECAYGALAGVIFGVVYWRSRRNLLAAVTVHVLINALPAMTMLRFG